MKKKLERSRHWFLTLPDEPQVELEKKLSSYEYIGQQERGSESTIRNEEGYLHYHVLIDSENAIAFSTLKRKFPKAHIEVPVSKGAVYKYVTKKETATGVKICSDNFPHERYKKAQAKEAKPVERMAQIIEANPELSYYELLLRDPSLFGGVYSQTAKDLIYANKLKKQTGSSRDIEVTYIYGKTGVGKSRYIAENFNRKEVYRVTNTKHPFDGYSGQDVLVFEEFSGQFSIEEMLNWLDRYWIDLPARYENKPALYTKVFVLTNIPFGDLYRDVQKNNPEQFNALRRRFTNGIFEMIDGGELVEQTLNEVG